MGPLAKFRAISTQFWAPAPVFTETDVRSGSVVGKVFMVTGGNASLGKMPAFGAYTMLFVGLSPEINMENNGIFVFPRGILVHDHAVVRQDILKAMEPGEKGGKAIREGPWVWCESRWSVVP
ncbi:hypothetical protein GGS20DRAFT_585421 [Poronia punctata]|nr:hypothetical protein GGS20DRAFT_585421 [Poronia punctata]